MSIVSSKRGGFTFSKIQLLLVTLFLASNFTYFTMAPRVLNILGVYEPGGILIFPLTFLLSDVITEVYSYKYSRFLVWCTLLMLGIFTIFTWLSMYIPTVVDYGYKGVFSNYPRLYLGVFIATFLSFFINNTIIAKLKVKWHGRIFWLRSLISTSIGHAIFSATWAIIFHFGEVRSTTICKLIICMYAWKMAFEILATPFVAILTDWIKKKEGFDVFDYNTNFNPFRLVD